MKHILSFLLLVIVACLLAGCGKGGVMNISQEVVKETGEAVVNLSGNITDTSVQKEALYTKMRTDRDSFYSAMYAKSGFSLEWAEVKRTVTVTQGTGRPTTVEFTEFLPKVTFKETPRFQQNLPGTPSKHPFWEFATSTVKVGVQGFLAYTGITALEKVTTTGWKHSAPQYYGPYAQDSYNPITTNPPPEIALQ